MVIVDQNVLKRVHLTMHPEVYVIHATNGPVKLSWHALSDLLSRT